MKVVYKKVESITNETITAVTKRLKETEDEFHFILVCPFNKEIREMY